MVRAEGSEGMILIAWEKTYSLSPALSIAYDDSNSYHVRVLYSSFLVWLNSLLLFQVWVEFAVKFNCGVALIGLSPSVDYKLPKLPSSPQYYYL